MSDDDQTILDELRALRREVREVAGTVEAIRESVLGHGDRLQRLERTGLARPTPPPGPHDSWDTTDGDGR